MIVTIVPHHSLTGTLSSPCLPFAGEIHYDGPWLHRRNRLRVNEPRRGFPRNERGGDDDVGLERALVNELFLSPDVILAQLPCVSARILRVPAVEIELDKLCAEALHLFLHHRARIEGFDDGSDATRCRYA